MTQLVRHLSPLAALLLGAAFLFFAGGMNGLLLPLRGADEGFSAFALGLLGTGWAIGYVAGCLKVPALVAAAGHVRAFGVMAALAAISVLLSLLVPDQIAWIVLRAIAGFAFAGAAMIVESWLSEHAGPQSRGRVFGAYTMVQLVTSTAGQMALTLGDPAGHALFVLCAIGYILALLPTAISTVPQPRPLVVLKLDPAGLWRRSPVAALGALLLGVSNGAFGTLGAVYGGSIGLEIGTIALFLSIPVVASALVQLPVGHLSDRIDRRYVLLGLIALALGVDAAFLLAAPQDPATNLLLGATFGAAVFTMYPVMLAHASDGAPQGSAIQTSGGLLLLFGIGAIIGPALAGAGMFLRGPSSLFAITFLAHAAMGAFTIWRCLQRSAAAEHEKGPFQATLLPGRGTTPETALLAAGEAAGRAGDNRLMPA